MQALSRLNRRASPECVTSDHTPALSSAPRPRPTSVLYPYSSPRPPHRCPRPVQCFYRPPLWCLYLSTAAPLLRECFVSRTPGSNELITDLHHPRNLQIPSSRLVKHTATGPIDPEGILGVSSGAIVAQHWPSASVSPCIRFCGRIQTLQPVFVFGQNHRVFAEQDLFHHRSLRRAATPQNKKSRCELIAVHTPSLPPKCLLAGSHTQPSPWRSWLGQPGRD